MWVYVRTTLITSSAYFFKAGQSSDKFLFLYIFTTLLQNHTFLAMFPNNAVVNIHLQKTGVRRGIPIFLIFAPKHRLWVLVRTASSRQF